MGALMDINVDPVQCEIKSLWLTTSPPPTITGMWVALNTLNWPVDGFKQARPTHGCVASTLVSMGRRSLHELMYEPQFIGSTTTPTYGHMLCAIARTCVEWASQPHMDSRSSTGTSALQFAFDLIATDFQAME